MVLAIIFLVLFAVLTGISIYRSVNLVKSPMIEINYRDFLMKNALFVGGAVISFLVASFGFYMWLGASPDALHVVELVIGALLFSASLLIAINVFIIHYYGRNIPEKLDKWLYRLMMIGFSVATVFFFVWTNGLAPYLTYPVVNGISFTKGLVSPDSGNSPNLAFYAICILSGAILVYFLCDHFMYKEYGQHGIYESTFFIAFPAGIIGARIAYVVGNWNQEFAGQPFWHVFAIWEGGITILGGAIAGIVAGVLWFIWRNKGKSIWIAFDMVLPAILIAQAIGRWGNFFNCEVHGILDSVENWKWLPEIIWRNAIYSSTSGLAPEGQIYVPLFFIEAVVNLFGYFFLAHLFGKALRKYTELGDVGFGYIIWYGLTRVFMEPLRSTNYQMGNNGYWSWVWSMIFVFVGTLLIVINHVVRSLLRKKNDTFSVKPYDITLGAIASSIIVVLGGALIAVGVYLIANNEYIAIVAYNGFHIGLILLVLGLSVLLCLGISLPILINGINKKQSVKTNE